jgi:hypothetical protein
MVEKDIVKEGACNETRDEPEGVLSDGKSVRGSWAFQSIRKNYHGQAASEYRKGLFQRKHESWY